MTKEREIERQIVVLALKLAALEGPPLPVKAGDTLRLYWKPDGPEAASAFAEVRITRGDILNAGGTK